MNHDWHRLEYLFFEAIKLQGEERQRFLKQIRRDEPELYLLITELVGHCDEADDFLEKPILSDAYKLLAYSTPDRNRTLEDFGLCFEDDGHQSEKMLERLDSFEILQKIGEGGMGEVYLARQKGPLQRQVALKIIKNQGYSSTRQTLFEAERKILASMNHNHIAQLYEAGTTSKGVPYFSMEFIPDGVNFMEFCNDGESMAFDTCLHIFLQVCEGVIHAHQRGIIHRDLKPSNILVTRQNDVPVSKIIDFGIAKDIEDLEIKRSRDYHNTRIGTPRYMSPEQTDENAAVDIRTDVYSLGVLLYELLTGQPLFDERFEKALPGEQLQLVRNYEPLKPSGRLRKWKDLEGFSQKRRLRTGVLVRRVQGDLDWITMRALAKLPDSRYQTVNAFAEDIRRFLANQPVSAVSKGFGYTLSKFCRRNKLAAIAAGSAFLAILAVFIVVSLGLFMTNQAKSEAEAHLDRERRIRSFMEEMILKNHPNRMGPDVKFADVLFGSKKGLSQDFKDHPELEAEMQYMYGQSYLGMGMAKDAQICFERAARLFKLNNSGDHLRIFETHERLAYSFLLMNRVEEAEVILQESLARQNHIEAPNDTIWSETQIGLGNVYCRLGRTEEAKTHYQNAYRQLRDDLGKTREIRFRAQHGMANVLYLQGNFQDAKEMLIQILEAQKQLFHPDHGDVLKTMSTLTSVLLQLGEYDDAERLYQAAFVHLKNWDEKHTLVLSFRHDRANLLLHQKKYPQSEIIARDVLEKRRTSVGPLHLKTLDTWTILAVTMTESGKIVEGIEVLRDILAAYEKAGHSNHPSAFRVMNNLGDGLKRLNRFDEALGILENALSRQQKVMGENHPKTLLTMGTIGEVFWEQKKIPEALTLFEELVKRAEESEPNSVMTAVYRGYYAGALARSGRSEEAEPIFLQSLKDLEKVPRYLSLIQNLMKGLPLETDNP